MTEPDAAVRAAAEALHRRESPTGNCNGHCIQQARAAVAAARPIIEAHARYGLLRDLADDLWDRAADEALVSEMLPDRDVTTS